MNMTVDQSDYWQKDRNAPKETSVHYAEEDDDSYEEIDNHKENPDPFLLTNTKVMCGEGRAIVCAVGENTLMARRRNKKAKKDKNKDKLIMEE